MDHSEVVTADRELTLTRVFDAPRELVFRMWSDPQHVAQWWGPAGFTNPVCEMDVRPGGKLRIVMRAPDGTDYPMTGTFREVVAPERLVFTNAAIDEHGNALIDGLTIVTFTKEGAKTKLTVQTRAVALAPLATRMLEGMDSGWRQTLDRLEEHVRDECGRASGRPADRALEISRIVDAPRERVFKAWTDPEQIARWWGPQGFTTTSLTMDLHPGGAYRACMRSPTGTLHCRQGVYQEIVPPERLVFTFAWEGATGDPGPQTVVTVTFAAQRGKTLITLHQATFETVAACDDHRGGWTSCLERFAEYLAAA
jgi:uncharacterized protein YndB with AHSA1/START domain